MKIRVFSASWKGGRRNFRLEVEGSMVVDVCNMVVDVCNKGMDTDGIKRTFCQCLRLPEFLRAAYHQGQKDGMNGSVELETTKMEYDFGQ